MQIHAVATAAAGSPTEVVVVSPPGAAALPPLVTGNVRSVVTPFVAGRPSAPRRVLRRVLGPRLRSPLGKALRREGVEVVLLTVTFAEETRHVVAVGWIPDFQHAHLPEYFSAEELRNRDASFNLLARDAELVLLSSESALADFAAFAPDHADKGRVASFPSILAYEAVPAPERAARERFHLPEKFALVVNQFWGHKNHRVVVEAVGALKRRGISIPVVMVGLPVDYRDPTNRPVSDVLHAVALHDVGERVTVLGEVTVEDLMDLMRTAAAIIQPSRFEGWSTVVQDAKALGRPLLCSDIAIHREQAPGAIGFFGCDDPASLASLLADAWPTLRPGPDDDSERRALENERTFARAYGEGLLAILGEARARRTTRQ